MNKNDIRAFKHNEVAKKSNVQMRDIIYEEQKSVSEYKKSTNGTTGITFGDNKDMITRLKEFVEFLTKKIDTEYRKLSISSEDAIRKNSYCLALQQNIWALENILNGKDWNYKE